MVIYIYTHLHTYIHTHTNTLPISYILVNCQVHKYHPLLRESEFMYWGNLGALDSFNRVLAPLFVAYKCNKGPIRIGFRLLDSL